MEYQVYDKFEYKVITTSNSEKTLEKFLNTMGNEGWELVSYNPININCKLILKRKLECTNIINE